MLHQVKVTVPYPTTNGPKIHDQEARTWQQNETTSSHTRKHKGGISLDAEFWELLQCSGQGVYHVDSDYHGDGLSWPRPLSLAGAE